MPNAPTILPPFAYTGRKLGTAVLCYVVAVIVVITLEPFAFARPTSLTITWFDGWFDIVANVALFVPPGFLFALTRSATAPAAPANVPAARRRALRDAMLVGLATSAAIELVQVFEPQRFPSPTDVTTNALGAALGAWLFTRAARRLGADTPIVGRLALELPLMGLVYLLVPLCSLAALTVGGGAVVPGARLPLPRGWGLVALALFGGTLLGHVQRWHFGPSRVLARHQTALVAAGWFALGALPALATAPRTFAAGLLAAGIAAWSCGRAPDGVAPINRRFELDALGRAVPWLAAYLALVPLTDPVARPVLLGKLDILHVVESLAGFTALGYVLAEGWGRLELRYRHTAWRVGLVAAGAAIVAEALRRGALPTGAAGIVGVGQHVLAAAYGGWMYHLQRAHVRALVAARRETAAPAEDGGIVEPARRTA